MIMAYLPNNRNRISQNTAVNQHISNPITKIEFAVIKTVAWIICSVSIPEQIDRSTDVDPSNHDGNPVATYKSQTDPECLCNTKDTAIES